MGFYKRKQGVIKAHHWGREIVPDWLAADLNDPDGKSTIFYMNDDPLQGKVIGIVTNNGVANALEGDYVIKNQFGELYPCDEPTFEANYEKIADE